MRVATGKLCSASGQRCFARSQGRRALRCGALGKLVHVSKEALDDWTNVFGQRLAGQTPAILGALAFDEAPKG